MTDSYIQPSREWWAQRWIEVLESFGYTRRLARARTYAREGNVLRIDFKGSKVIARVQGTAPSPYKVTLSLDPFTDEQWGYVVETMAERAIFSAKLLAGEMPQTIEEVFTANGLSLFPFTKFDIHSRCSCPDPANPCKHIGAVYYQLGDRFSDDPFVLFQLRGRSKEKIIEALRQTRSTTEEPLNSTQTNQHGDPITSQPLTSEADPTDQRHEFTPLSVTSHSLDLEEFWQYSDQLEPSLVVIAPSSSETVLDVLGSIPIRVNISASATSSQDVSQTMMDYFTTAYQNVSQQALLAAMNTGHN